MRYLEHFVHFTVNIIGLVSTGIAWGGEGKEGHHAPGATHTPASEQANRSVILNAILLFQFKTIDKKKKIFAPKRILLLESELLKNSPCFACSFST